MKIINYLTLILVGVVAIVVFIPDTLIALLNRGFDYLNEFLLSVLLDNLDKIGSEYTKELASQIRDAINEVGR
jgi:hypothetical protein